MMGTVAQPERSTSVSGSSVSQMIMKREVCLMQGSMGSEVSGRHQRQ